MPIYEFQCQVCGVSFDQMMGLNDPNPPCHILHKSIDNEIVLTDHSQRLLLTAIANQLGEDNQTMVYGGHIFSLKDSWSADAIVGGQPQVVTRTLSDWIRDMTPCGGETSKLISATGFILKGSGWAKDGYA